MKLSFPVFLFALLFMIVWTKAHAQNSRFTSIRVVGHLDFNMKVPSMDDAGFGLQVDGALFANQHVRLLISTHYDHLLGDKQYIIINTGRLNKSGNIHGIQAGPEWMIRPWVSVTVQYGMFRHAIQAVDFTTDDGVRLGAAFIMGKRKRFAVQISRNVIWQAGENISYHNIGLGYRVL